MKLRILVVCGTGMGSSMILKIMVDRAVNEHHLPFTVESDVAAAAKSSSADLLLAGVDLAPTLLATGKPVVGIRNILDRGEIAAALQAHLRELGIVAAE
jgi:ascorbate PTS system EIIB component